MSRRRKWYRGVRGCSARLRCSGSVHSISWRRGRLILRDHDIQDERGLTALGGDPPECLRLYDAWQLVRKTSAGHRFIARHGEVAFEAVVAANLQQFARMTGSIQLLVLQQSRGGRVSSPSHHFEEMVIAEQALSVLLELPEEMRRRLDAEIALHLIRRQGSGEEEATRRAALTRALSQKANPALEASMRAWRRVDPAAMLTVETWVTDDGEPSIMGWLSPKGGLAAASLPLTWLVDVSARGMAEVDGCFVLEVLDVGERSMRVSAVRWERRFLDELAPPTGPDAARWRDVREWYAPVAGEGLAARDRKGRWRLRWL